MPPSNSYLSSLEAGQHEISYPLKVVICNQCWLAQTEEVVPPEHIFSSNYFYASSTSSTWLTHVENFTNEIIRRLELSSKSLVIEIAANDGYLLQQFKSHGIPCKGVEPSASVANIAKGKGIEIIQDFFSLSLAENLRDNGTQADLIVANNVLAHVPGINDFVAGISTLLSSTGVATFEFPEFRLLLENCLFDTIYHEHYSYLSLTSAINIFESQGLEVFDVERIGTHGGSLRLYAQKQGASRDVSPRVSEQVLVEQAAGMHEPGNYVRLRERVATICHDFAKFLRDAVTKGKSVAGYGAAAKGNTLLNSIKATNRDVGFIADRNPLKQGLFLPGSHIPVVSEEFLRDAEPDYVIIFPWNIKNELISQLSYIRDWGGSFVTAVPSLLIVD